MLKCPPAEHFIPDPSVNVIGCARAALRPVDISLEMLDLRCWILPREILVFIGTAGTDLVTTAPFIFFYTPGDFFRCS